MKVAFTHRTRLEYDAEVMESVMDVRLGPCIDEYQRWEHFELRIEPAASVRGYDDGFGNSAHLVTIAKPHRFIELVASGEVVTLLGDPFLPISGSVTPLSPGELADYLGLSRLIPRDERIEELAAPHRPKTPEDAFEAVQQLMHLVYDSFTYKVDVTTAATTVTDMLDSRIGVCQDFAHVLIGLCRAVGIPARYVSGYIVTPDGSADAEAPQRGAGASHAWAEAFTVTHGWRGFDPTNNLLASEHHVKIALGRDYRDTAPTQGTFRGTAEEKLSVEVTARRLD